MIGRMFIWIVSVSVAALVIGFCALNAHAVDLYFVGEAPAMTGVPLAAVALAALAVGLIAGGLIVAAQNAGTRRRARTAENRITVLESEIEKMRSPAATITAPHRKGFALLPQRMRG